MAILAFRSSNHFLASFLKKGFQHIDIIYPFKFENKNLYIMVSSGFNIPLVKCMSEEQYEKNIVLNPQYRGLLEIVHNRLPFSWEPFWILYNCVSFTRYMIGLKGIHFIFTPYQLYKYFLKKMQCKGSPKRHFFSIEVVRSKEIQRRLATMECTKDLILRKNEINKSARANKKKKNKKRHSGNKKMNNKS